MRKLCLGALLLLGASVAVLASPDAETPTGDAYWTSYVKTSQDTTKKIIEQTQDRAGIRLGFGVRDFTDPLGLAIPFFQLGYVQERKQLAYHLDLQIGVLSSKMRNNRALFFGGNYTDLYVFHEATMASLGGGVDWRLTDFDLGINGSVFALGGTNYSEVILSGLSVGVTISKPLVVMPNLTLSPYFGLDYNLINKVTLSGISYSTSGLNGMGVSFGVHVTPYW